MASVNQASGTASAGVRIANCSGFLGDRFSAAREMVEGGPIDFLTGDWLAELTMLILARSRMKHGSGGYARSFVDQMRDVLRICSDKGIRVVSNAGGLNPQACGAAVAEVASAQGLSLKVAVVTGDDLMAEPEILERLVGFGDQRVPSRDKMLTANAYLGCWGIVEALRRGADVVVTGRVTDAALVCGPAAFSHDWAPDEYDRLAGAVAAGHVIECGTQATGGNYSFFTEVEGREEVGGRARLGFPIAEVFADGSSIITKHPGTGGVVNRETVVSQLLYEVGSERYLGPDVTARFDSVTVQDLGYDRVRLCSTAGEAPPPTLKVGVNELGGFRNSFSVALTGLDIEEKARFAEAAFWEVSPLGPEDFDFVESKVVAPSVQDPPTQEEATGYWRLTVKDSDADRVGRGFSNAMVETALASIPGLYALSGPPGPGSPYGVFRPALVDASLVETRVGFLDGDNVVEELPVPVIHHQRAAGGAELARKATVVSEAPAPLSHESMVMPLGRVLGARSGDKGGSANLGVFATGPVGWEWLQGFLSVEVLRELLPEFANNRIDRIEFANLWALNFVIEGALQEGVAASTRQDPQAKALGEWFRARQVAIPEAVIVEAREARLRITQPAATH